MNQLLEAIMKKKAISYLIVIVISFLSLGLTFRDRGYTCPIDQHHFKTRMAASGTSFGIMLDFKRIGPIASPWTLAQCPKCGFVFYKDKYSKKEIDKLKNIVYSKKYKKEWKKNTTYYSLARIYEKLGHINDMTIAWTFVQASWQANNHGQYPKYAQLALLYLKKVKNDKPKNKQKSKGKNQKARDYVIAHYLCIELHRRLGQFEKALEYINTFPKVLNESEKTLLEYIDYQKELLEKKDSTSKRMREMKKKKSQKR